MSQSNQYQAIEKELLAGRNKAKAVSMQRYFKTGKGQYAEGDIFLGLTVPEVRAIVKKYRDRVTLADVAKLLLSKYHELRLAALHFLVFIYEHSDDAKVHKAIFLLYTKNTENINNWDLVDTSAAQIVGAYISNHMPHEERVLFIDRYCKSTDLWKNRIIVLATFYQIKKGNEKMLYYVARFLMHHPHDLIHKAIGWMLREVGKRDQKTLSVFLEEYSGVMPRTMLRYALEHYDAKEKSYFMKKKQLLV